MTGFAAPTIRDFEPADAAAVNQVALSAWQQYAAVFAHWTQTAKFVGNTAALTSDAQLIVAELDGAIRGVVGYVAPGRGRLDVFPPEWAIIRMLSVDPVARGFGIGRRLMQECVKRARAERVAVIGLHSSPVMRVALALYERMGFKLARALPDRNGVPYALYSMALDG